MLRRGVVVHERGPTRANSRCGIRQAPQVSMAEAALRANIENGLGEVRCRRPRCAFLAVSLCAVIAFTARAPLLAAIQENTRIIAYKAKLGVRNVGMPSTASSHLLPSARLPPPLVQQPSSPSVPQPYPSSAQQLSRCGDYKCDPNETIASCPADCPGVTTPEMCGEEPHSDPAGEAVAWGSAPEHRVRSAAECCARCSAHAANPKNAKKPCNSWVRILVYARCSGHGRRATACPPASLGDSVRAAGVFTALGSGRILCPKSRLQTPAQSRCHLGCPTSRPQPSPDATSDVPPPDPSPVQMPLRNPPCSGPTPRSVMRRSSATCRSAGRSTMATPTHSASAGSSGRLTWHTRSTASEGPSQRASASGIAPSTCKARCPTAALATCQCRRMSRGQVASWGRASRTRRSPGPLTLRARTARRCSHRRVSGLCRGERGRREIRIWREV